MKVKKIKMIGCCLCGKMIAEELANNAEPVMEGGCCDECNFAIVIPERMKNLLDDRNIVSDLSGHAWGER